MCVGPLQAQHAAQIKLLEYKAAELQREQRQEALTELAQANKQIQRCSIDITVQPCTHSFRALSMVD